MNIDLPTNVSSALESIGDEASIMRRIAELLTYSCVSDGARIDLQKAVENASARIHGLCGFIKGDLGRQGVAEAGGE